LQFEWYMSTLRLNKLTCRTFQCGWHMVRAGGCAGGRPPIDAEILHLHLQIPHLHLESNKYIACAIVSSRLDYTNSCLSGISSCLQHPSTTASSKLPRPRRSSRSLCYSITLVTCFHSLASYLSTSHFQARLPSISQPAYLSCLSIITSSRLRSNTIASIFIRPPSCWTSSQNYTCFSGLPICWTTNLELSA